jgi:hypothetical protein
LHSAFAQEVVFSWPQSRKPYGSLSMISDLGQALRGCCRLGVVTILDELPFALRHPTDQNVRNRAI